jgi:hypothetical protein
MLAAAAAALVATQRTLAVLVVWVEAAMVQNQVAQEPLEQQTQVVAVAGIKVLTATQAVRVLSFFGIQAPLQLLSVQD